MPPAKSGIAKLTTGEVALLRAWVDQGAKWPEKIAGGDGREKHWSFQPVKAQPVPLGESAIDHFVTVKLKEKGLALGMRIPGRR